MRPRFLYRLEVYDNTVPATQRMPLLGADNYSTVGSARRQLEAIAEKQRSPLQPIEHAKVGEWYNYGSVTMTIKKERLQ